ncbi:transcription initiation factor TFIID subunit 4b isoform X2 [Arachis duranensis]|uniref:Transcription initiation factor TFIID subunit 4b isoform X2 n=1 Tax=Arachis duranensis TaxID=130453 RepID=A0A9C6WRQ8_ARADU|nr:transcription initiation factor TFIID subunit 4b isoform X2 [Arachis duranensis]
MDFYSTVFILVHPNGYVEDTVDGPFQSSEPLLMSIHRQKSLLELKNLILRNMGELERKQISRMAYRLHVKIGPQASDCQVFWLKSDQDIQLMFGYHDSNSELRCIELYVKVEEDTISSASSKANPQVVQSENNVGRGAKRVQSPVTSPSFAFPILFENSETVDGNRSNICASPANMASGGVAVDKILPPKTGNFRGACSAFPPPTSKKHSFVGTGADLGHPPQPKMQKMVDGKGKPVENGVLLPTIEESDVYSKHFQAQGVCPNLEPPITSNPQMVLEGRVKELEIRLESKENERAALEELKVTLTAKISNMENKLKEADKEKSQLREKETASRRRIEQLEAEVKHLGCCVREAKERAHRNIMEQVHHLAPGIDFSRVHPDYQVVNGEIVNPNKDSVNNPPLSQDVASHNVNNPPLPQHVTSQNVNNPPLSQKQSQDERHLPYPVQASLQNSQTVGIQNLGKDPVPNNEVAKTLNPSSESQQYAKLHQISNQQATVNEQRGGQINRQKQVPFGMFLPILIPQLPKDRAMQLQTLFSKLKKDEIAKDSFVQLMKGIVGDQMLRLAMAKIQAQLLQMRPNQGPVEQQHPVRMPTVGLGARQLNDPHALAQLHQRSMNAAADQSRMTSSAVQTMENNARKSQELDARMETQGLQPSQLSSSNSISVSQEAERSSVHVHGLNKQPQPQPQHLHFPSAYGSSGGNYRPFSGPASSSASSIRPPPHESHMSQIPHQSTGPNHLGGATQGFIGMPKLEQQNSLNDPKRLPGGSVALLNNPASQQTPNAWQPPSNKDQSSGFLSSGSYVKKEPSDMPTEQQHRQNISKIHGLPSANSAQIEQASANQGTVKDEFSRGLPVSTSMAPTTSTGLTSLNSASPSGMAQLDPSVSLSTQVPSNTSGITVRAPVKKPSVGQKKPLEALGSSPPPPPSKKQKGSGGGSVEQSIDQLNDVTAVSGVDLREEEEQLFSGPKEDSRVSEATRRAVQEEEERLILQKIPLQKKLFEIMFKYGLKGVSNDVERCLSLCVEERMRGLISNLIRMSKQRVDFEKTRHRTVVTSDVQQQIMTINRKVREEWEKRQAEAEKLRKQNDVDGNAGADGDKDKDEGRNKSSKVNKEEDDKMRTNAANVAARAAVGGDDMLSKWQLMAEQARQKREGVTDTSSGSQPAKDASRKSSASGKSTKDNHEGDKKGSTNFATSGAIRKHGRNNSLVTQTKIARSISVKDVIAVLEREPQMSKSSLIHRLYEKIHSDAQPE